MIALSWSGCATHKTITANHSVEHGATYEADSMATVAVQDNQATWLLLKKQEPVTVPQSKVTLSIAPDSLQALPSGAAYTARNGQASLSVAKSGDSGDASPPIIVIEATCDSLQLVCEALTLQLQREQSASRAEVSGLKNRITELKAENREAYEKKEKGVRTWLDWLLAGFLPGAICATTVYYLILRKTRKCIETEQT